jgi:uncharacterized membrane protein YphA (DoxX/SURF4 family)
LLRLAAGIPLVYFGMEGALNADTGERIRVVLEVMSGVGGFLLLPGLWTPIAGGLVTVTQLCILFSQPISKQAFAHILLPVLGAALALLGPGAWSADARLFGRKIFVNGRRTGGIQPPP